VGSETRRRCPRGAAGRPVRIFRPSTSERRYVTIEQTVDRGWRASGALTSTDRSSHDRLACGQSPPNRGRKGAFATVTPRSQPGSSLGNPLATQAGSSRACVRLQRALGRASGGTDMDLSAAPLIMPLTWCFVQGSGGMVRQKWPQTRYHRTSGTFLEAETATQRAKFSALWPPNSQRQDYGRSGHAKDLHLIRIASRISSAAHADIADLR